MLLGLIAAMGTTAMPAPSLGDHAWRRHEVCEGVRNGINCNDLDSGGIRHWSDRGGTLAVMWFVDRTDQAWPVLASASEWNKSPAILITYEHSPRDQCPSHCVSVNAKPRSHFADQRCVNFSGDMHGPIHENRPHFRESVRVHFNRDCRDAANEKRRELTCHEEGHALGLDGRPHSHPSCMRAGRLDRPVHRTPNDHDFHMLRRQVYDHND